MADTFDDPDDPVPSTTGGARAAHAAAAARMKATPFPGSAAAAIDAASKDQPAAGAGSHPAADEDAGSHPAGEATDDAAPADDQAAQPRDQAPRDKQPRTLEGAQEEGAPPSGDDKAAKDESAYEKWLARFNGDQEAAAKAAFESDTKLAELAKQKAAPADGTTDEEAPADQEVDLKEVEAKVAEDLVEFRQTDPECTSWNGQYLDNNKRLDDILKFERRGDSFVPVSGELVTLEKKLTALNAQLDPKSYGLPERQLDTVEKEDIEEQIKEAKRDRQMLLSERRDLLADNKDLRGRWHSRLRDRADAVRDHLSSHAEQQRAAESDSDTEAEYTQEWNTEFDRVTKALSKERRAEARRDLLAASTAVFEAEGDIVKVGPWMDRQMKQLTSRWDREDGQKDKRQAKEQERTTRQPAPRGPAATAQPDRTRHQSPRDARLAAERRATALARGLGTRPVA